MPDKCSKSFFNDVESADFGFKGQNLFIVAGEKEWNSWDSGKNFNQFLKVTGIIVVVKW